MKSKENIEDYIDSIIKELKQNGIRIVDWSDSSPRFKFNEWELKGVLLVLRLVQETLSQIQ